MNENNKFRLVAFLLSLNSVLFIAAIVAVFTRFSRHDLNSVLDDYRSIIVSNSLNQTTYISNLTTRTSALLLQLSASLRSDSLHHVSASDPSDFRSGLNLIQNAADTNDYSFCKFLNPSNYHYAVAHNLKIFTYQGYSYQIGDRFLDGGKIIDFDNFAIKTDVALYNLLNL